MSVTTVLFRPFAGYILDNFNRYRVYLLFLALFCLPFLGFALISVFGLLVVIRLYMGAVYSVCGSATMTLAGMFFRKIRLDLESIVLHSQFPSEWRLDLLWEFRFRTT